MIRFFFKAGHFLLVLCILLMLAAASVAQESDFQIWSRISLKWDAKPNTRLYVEEELRFRENAQRLDKNHTELGFGQKVTERFELGAFYRFINIRDLAGYNSNNHRIALQASYDIPADPWKFWLRARYQLTWDEIYRSENWNIPENYLRTEAGLSRESNNKKFDYYADLEIWLPIDRGHPVFLEQYRFTAGLEFKIDRNRRWELFYRLQQETQVRNPETLHIMGIAYTYLFR